MTHLLALLLTASLRTVLNPTVTLPALKALIMISLLDLKVLEHLAHLLKTLLVWRLKAAPTLNLETLRAILTLLLLINFLLMFYKTLWSLKVTTPLLKTILKYLLLQGIALRANLLMTILWVMVNLAPSLAFLILLMTTHLCLLKVAYK